MSEFEVISTWTDPVDTAPPELLQDPKPCISPTRMTSCERCPEAFRRRYIEGELIPPKLCGVRGSAVHMAAEVNYRQKITTHEDLSAEDMKDIAANAFDNKTAGDEYALSNDDRRMGVHRALGMHKDKAVELADVFARRVAKNYQPAFVEQSVRVEIPGASHDLLVVLDMATVDDVVVDLKTTGKMLKAADAHHSVQLTCQASGFHKLTGSPPEELVLQAITTWAKPSCSTLHTKRGPEDFNALAARVNAFIEKVDKQVFGPAPEGAWWCSPNWCGYWYSCPYVNSKRDR